MILNHTLSYKDFTSIFCNFRTWFINSRPIALPQSLLPAITAFALASSSQTFNPYLAFLAVIGVIFGHLGSNLFDDYFDYLKNRSDYRDALAHKGMRARIAKCIYLTSNQNTLPQLFAACLIFSTIALIIGLIIWFFRGNSIFIWTVIAAFLAITYSGKPFSFSYHGFGEIIIAIMFGPLAMTGIYFAATGTFNPNILWIAFPIGILVMNIVYTHSILDFIPDKEINKKTLAVLINNKKGMLIIEAFCCFTPFVIITTAVLLNHINLWFLLVFLTLPMAINLFYLMLQFVKNPNKEFEPKIWMGPFEKWEQKKEYGVGWFIIRWMLARNLVSFFSIIITIVAILIGILS